MNGSDIRFSKGEAADVFIEIDKLLEGHAIGGSFVVGREEFFLIMDFVNVLPAASRKGFQDGGTADVVEKAVPVDRIFEVVKRFGSDIHIAGISLLGQENRFWDSDAELCGDGIVEKLIVRRPP